MDSWEGPFSQAIGARDIERRYRVFANIEREGRRCAARRTKAVLKSVGQGGMACETHIGPTTVVNTIKFKTAFGRLLDRQDSYLQGKLDCRRKIR